MEESSNNILELGNNTLSRQNKQYEAAHKIEILEKLLIYFLKIYESPSSTLRTSDNDKLKRYFQIASAIENAIRHLESIDQLNNGHKLLKKIFSNEEKILEYYNTNFLKEACDHLLSKFFTIKESLPFKTEVAVRIYTSVLPAERFEKFLNKLFVETASYKVIKQFVIANNNVNSKLLQFKLILHEWISINKKGPKELTTLIQDFLSLYKVQKSLHILIGIISLNTDSLEENSVRSLVLKQVLDKMLCRNVLSKKFWITMFEIDHVVLLTACILSEEFYMSICNFLIFVGSMMDIKKEKGCIKWVPSTISVYPEFTYDKLLKILQILSSKDFCKREVTMRRLLEAEEATECLIWRHILMIL